MLGNCVYFLSAELFKNLFFCQNIRSGMCSECPTFKIQIKIDLTRVNCSQKHQKMEGNIIRDKTLTACQNAIGKSRMLTLFDAFVCFKID